MVLSEEQSLLQHTAREFLQAQAPVTALRALRDSGDERGYCPDLWSRMTELGWAAMTIPARYEGLEFGYTGMGLVMQECGRLLVASPLFATIALGADCVLQAGSEGQREALLPAVARGDITLALALEEGPRHAPWCIGTRAERCESGYLLSGSKTFVLDGHSADHLVVAARTNGKAGDREGIILFLLGAGMPGLRVTRTPLIDSRGAAQLDLDGVEVGAEAVIGEPGRGAEVLEPVLDRARILLCAEMLGSVRACFEATLQHLREREQFGSKIGSFQALQHRAAQMFADIELAAAVVAAALAALDGDSPDIPLLASLAKARLNDTVERVTNEAVQMHGGMGVTDELDIGLYLKRGRVTMQALGDSAYHVDRYAELAGY